MWKVFLAATLSLAIHLPATSYASEPEQAAPRAVENGAAPAPAVDALNELQKHLNKASRAETTAEARSAIRELLDAPEALDGLSAESRIKFRKALEAADTSLDADGTAAVNEAAKAHIKTAQTEIDLTLLERAAQEKKAQESAEKIAWGGLALVALIVLLPVLVMLLFAAPELLILLLLIGFVAFALFGGGIAG